MEFDAQHLERLEVITKQLLVTFPRLLAIYVFGSFGTQYENFASDIDIAVLSSKQIDKVKLWRTSQEIASQLNRDVELIDLDAASSVFRYQVVMTATRIYCSDVKLCDAIENRYMSMYLRFNEERAQIIQDKRQGTHG